MDLSRQELEQVENIADLYSIFVATEYLERAYVRDAVSGEDYTSACSKLITQYKTASQLASVSVMLKESQLHCPAACKRLMDIGVPATIEHATAETSQAKSIAEAVQYFITLMDSLKLNMVAVDQIHPLLSDLVQSLGKVSLSNYSGKEKMKEWLITLNQLKASDEMTMEQVRQFMFDLESAHTEFHRALSK